MPELPPVLQVLLEEDLEKLANAKQATPRLRAGLFKDLKRQAEWTFSNFEYPDHREQTSRRDLRVTASGALNPFAVHGPCTETECRVTRAKTFARTVGVWADTIYLPDTLSANFMHLSRISASWTERFAGDILILRELLPLVKAGVVEFGNVPFAYCEDCRLRVPTETAAELVPTLLKEAEFEFRDGWLGVTSPSILDDGGVVFKIPRSEHSLARDLVKNQRSPRLADDIARFRFNILWQLIREPLIETFSDLLSAQNLHSIVVSGTRSDLLLLKAIEKELPDTRAIEAWEQTREVRIPWVSDLTTEEIVQLRECTATALPRFRQMFLRSVASKDVASSIRDLREQAAEVEAELKALKPRSRGRDRASIGLVSTAVALYGVASTAIPALAGAAQLVATLALMHNLGRTDRAEEEKIKSRPGYVLLKAQDLLAARSGHSR